MDSLEAANNFENQRITVMGIGRFGGGVGAIRFLVERGARVVVTDLASKTELAQSLSQFDGLDIEQFRLGGHCEDDFRDADLIVVNPAVPPQNRFLDIAREANVPLTSEMNLFWQLNRARVVAVTGSNGKSTTTAMIHSILKAADICAWLGGNIGNSLLPQVDQIEADDWCVLELSSFQLEDLNRIQAAPDIAVVTNFSPNHLDRHMTLDAYRHAKQSILRWQSSEQIAILNADDPDVRNWETQANCRFYSTPDSCDATHCRVSSVKELPIQNWLTLPGKHNLQNATAATAAAIAVGVPIEAIQSGLQSYQALPHRLQFVAEVNGRRFYNDSLATTPESVAAALDAFTQPVILLAGGYDKQIDLLPLAETIAHGTKAVSLLGQTAQPLRSLLARQTIVPKSTCCESFEAAFEWAVGQSSPGDVVLLSPGCASYDWFRNFAERGERFTDLVNALEADTRERGASAP